MFRNQIADYFHKKPSVGAKLVFSKILPDEFMQKKPESNELSYNSNKVINYFNSLTANIYFEKLNDICSEIEKETERSQKELIDVYTLQENYLNEEFLNNLISETQKKLIDEKPPFYKIPAMGPEEKARRNA